MLTVTEIRDNLSNEQIAREIGGRWVKGNRSWLWMELPKKVCLIRLDAQGKPERREELEQGQFIARQGEKLDLWHFDASTVVPIKAN